MLSLHCIKGTNVYIITAKAYERPLVVISPMAESEYPSILDTEEF